MISLQILRQISALAVTGGGHGRRSRQEVLRQLDLAVQDLAGGTLGQGAEQPDMAGILVGRHPLPGEGPQFRGVAVVPGLSTTAAPTSSPSSACGMPMTATSATA